MKKSNLALVTAALAFSTNVNAAILLDFEGIPNLTPVGNFYNGGAGPNYGISFSSEVVAGVDFEAGGTGNFANEPSPDTAISFGTGSTTGVGIFTLDYASGFKTSFSFFYSTFFNLTVTVWDGLSGTGTQLASLTLTPQYNANNCTGDPAGVYCNWTLATLAFSGTAQSVSFQGSRRSFVLDNFTLIPSAATQVPVPGSLLMLGTGLLAGAWVNRKSKPRLS